LHPPAVRIRMKASLFINIKFCIYGTVGDWLTVMIT
jgi:hypothetical protein